MVDEGFRDLVDVPEFFSRSRSRCQGREHLLTLLAELQLNAQVRPDEMIRSGWDFHAVYGAVTKLPRR